MTKLRLAKKILSGYVLPLMLTPDEKYPSGQQSAAPQTDKPGSS
jgi:hypothetical protein